MIGMTVDERLWIQYRGVTRTYTCLIRARYNRVCSRACYLPDEPRPIANRRWSNPRLDVTRDAVLLPAYHQTRRRLGSSDDDVGETACLVLTEGGIRNNSDSNDIRNRERKREKGSIPPLVRILKLQAQCESSQAFPPPLKFINRPSKNVILFFKKKFWIKGRTKSR